MAKGNSIARKTILILLLIVIPILVMSLMGMGEYDANEFLILTIAILADVVFYILCKIFILQKTLR